MPELDLSLITTDALSDELLSRSDHGLIVLLTERTEDTHFIVRKWTGNSFTIAGLASDISTIVLDEYHEREFEEDEDE